MNGVFTPVGIKPEDVRHQFGGTIGGPIVKRQSFLLLLAMTSRNVISPASPVLLILTS